MPLPPRRHAHLPLHLSNLRKFLRSLMPILRPIPWFMGLHLGTNSNLHHQCQGKRGRRARGEVGTGRREERGEVKKAERREEREEQVKSKKPNKQARQSISPFLTAFSPSLFPPLRTQSKQKKNSPRRGSIANNSMSGSSTSLYNSPHANNNTATTVFEDSWYFGDINRSEAGKGELLFVSFCFSFFLHFYSVLVSSILSFPSFPLISPSATPLSSPPSSLPSSQSLFSLPVAVTPCWCARVLFLAVTLCQSTHSRIISSLTCS